MRSTTEARFGHDLSTVRVHAVFAADSSAAELRASAYTVGEQIAFRSGRYRPDQRQGQVIIDLDDGADVVQQRRGGEQPAAGPAIEADAQRRRRGGDGRRAGDRRPG